MILAFVLFLLLAVSLLANFGQLASSLARISPGGSKRSTGPRLDEVTLKDNESRNKIAVVRIEGVITGSRIDGTPFNLTDVVKEQLRRAGEDRRVVAVLLKVDSPGGEVLASDDIANALHRFQDETGKPVVVSMGNLAASGGYYVSAPCRYIVANELTFTGSIGVIMSGMNYRGLMDKVGVVPQVYKSGKFKDMLSGSRRLEDVPAEEAEMMHRLILETYGKFTNVVAKGRAEAHKANGSNGRELAPNWSAFADGRVVSGNEAYKLGFVDEVGDFDTAVNRALKIVGERNADLIEYRRVSDLSDLFQLFGQGEAKTVKVDLGFQLPKLRACQAYFLMDGYLD
jgi:protease-4